MSLLDRFDTAWQEGKVPSLGAFLSGLPEGQPQARRQLLTELVKIDLEYRWRRNDLPGESGSLAPRPRLEDYLRRYPELGTLETLPLELVGEEYRARRGGGDRPTLAEYAARFPHLTGELPKLLSQARKTEISRRFGEYEILEEIGRGGMGIVYRARQVSLNRLVALKMLRSGTDADQEESTRFWREAGVIARFQHPHIVQVYHFGEDNGRPFLELELVDGGSLAEFLCGTPQPARESAAFMRILVETMQYAHERGIVHRDLKPANILLQESGARSQESGVRNQGSGVRGQESGLDTATDSPLTTRHSPFSKLPLTSYRPKITDFGLARQLDADIGQTRTGMIVGTPSYMAPEQARSERDIGPAADIYALGAILYELLTGRPPFRAATLLETLEQVRGAEPVAPSRLQPKLPRDLETIVLKAMAKEPARRYPSAAALANDLQRFLDDRPIRARRSGAWEHTWRWCRRNRLVASLAGLLAVILLGAGVGGLIAAYQFRALALQADEAKREAENNARQIQESMERKDRAYQLMERGTVHAGGKRLDRAVADLTEATTLLPDVAGVWSARGEIYEILRLYELAAQDYVKAFQLHRSLEASTWWSYAALLLYVRDLPGYAQACSEMVKYFGTDTDPRTSWWLVESCTLGAESGVDPELIVKLAKRALAHEPKSTSYALAMAAAQYRAGRLEAALQAVRDLTQPGDTRAFFEAQPMLALIYARLGIRKEARLWMERTNRTFERHFSAMRPHPLDWRYEFLGYHDLLKLILLYREAREVIQDAPPTEEILADILQARSLAYLGDLESAEHCFSRAIERQPTNDRPWLMRAVFWGQLGQWARALADLEQANALRPLHDFWELGSLALMQLRQGATDGYAATRRQMLKRFEKPDSAVQGNFIAWTCSLAPGTIQDATATVRLAEPALKCDSTDPWCHLALGAALHRAGQFQPAAARLREALEASSTKKLQLEGVALAKLFLAMALQRFEQRSEATQLLNAAGDAIDRASGWEGNNKPGGAWQVWAACHIVRQEAEALINHQATK
jgi:serine/threonine protein kinase/Flp pilus assembly protein TadD